MFGQGLQFVGQNRDRSQLRYDNEAQRELELRRALIEKSAMMGHTDSAQMQSGLSGIAGAPYNPNMTTALGRDVNALEGGQAANAVQFGTAGAKSVEGGAVPRANPYAYEGNIPAAMGVRGSTRNISGTGGTKPSIEYLTGGVDGDLYSSGQYKFKGGNKQQIDQMRNQFGRAGAPPPRPAPEAEGAGGLTTTPPDASTDPDAKYINEFIKMYGETVNTDTIKIMDIGGVRVITALNNDGQPVMAPMNE
jgi:hypothetical protein